MRTFERSLSAGVRACPACGQPVYGSSCPRCARIAHGNVRPYMYLGGASVNPPIPWLTGIAGWWDPSDTANRVTGLDSVSTPVITSLLDKSGNSHDATASSADNAPGISASPINGLDLADFRNGGAGGVSGLAFTALSVGGTLGGSVFLVVRMDADAAGDNFGGSSTGNAIGRGLTAGNNRMGGMAGAEAAHSYVLGQAEVREVIKTSNTLLVARRNGTQVATATTGATTSTVSQIGSSTFNGAWQGSVGEVLLYARALTDAEASTIRKYLGARWGVTVT